MVPLRPYQEEALRQSADAEARGIRRQLGVAATGLGKTVMFCTLAQRRGGRALILAHRDELINQAAAQVAHWWPGADVGVVKAERNEVGSQVVVASVQTLSRASRLRQLLAPFADDQRLLSRAEPFSTVVVDEAHHAAAASYRSVLDALGCGVEPEVPWAPPLLFGVTATPDRGDGHGLNSVFDQIVFNYDILWGMNNDYLTQLRGLHVKVAKFSEEDLKVSKGDFEVGRSGKVLSDAGAPAVAVKSWHEHAAGRRTIAFTPTVALAQEVADAFASAGVSAGMVHGGTPTDERRSLLRKLREGEITVMANCGVLTEGFDEPRVDCILMMRPTKSRALYTQCVGRGTRKHPDKEDCLILDLVGVSKDHSLVTLPSLFGLEGDIAERAGGGAVPIAHAVADFQREQVRIGKIKAEEVELFGTLRANRIAWVRVHKDGQLRHYVRSLGTDANGNRLATVVLKARSLDPDEDVFVAGIMDPDGSNRQVLVDNVPMEEAQAVAEDYIRSHTPSMNLLRADASWRSRPPTAKALSAAAKWRIKVDPSWNAGQVSDAIDARRAATAKYRKKEPAHP